MASTPPRNFRIAAMQNVIVPAARLDYRCGRIGRAGYDIKLTHFRIYVIRKPIIDSRPILEIRGVTFDIHLLFRSLSQLSFTNTHIFNFSIRVVYFCIPNPVSIPTKTSPGRLFSKVLSCRRVFCWC